MRFPERGALHLQAPLRTLILRPQLPAQATWVLAASWTVWPPPCRPPHSHRQAHAWGHRDAQEALQPGLSLRAPGDGATVVTPALAEDFPLPPCAKPCLCGADRCPALGAPRHCAGTARVSRVLCLQGPPALPWEKLASVLLTCENSATLSFHPEEQPHREAAPARSFSLGLSTHWVLAEISPWGLRRHHQGLCVSGPRNLPHPRATLPLPHVKSMHTWEVLSERPDRPQNCLPRLNAGSV